MGLLAHLIIVPAWVLPPGQLDPLKNGKVVRSLKKGNIETTWRSEVGGPFFGAQVAFDQMKQILLWQLQLKKTIAVGKLPIASFFLCL